MAAGKIPVAIRTALFLLCTVMFILCYLTHGGKTCSKIFEYLWTLLMYVGVFELCGIMKNILSSR